MIPIKPHRRLSRNWCIPLVYALAALVLGMVLPRLEHWLVPHLVSTVSVQAAISVCSSVASGMISLTAIVFSLTFVMVQFSATAYSPRLVLWLARDPVMSHALGAFTATFLYALILLAWMDRDNSGRVPFITGWILLGMLVASMAMFIALIERIGLLQVSRMLIFTGDQGRQAIAELYHVTVARGSRLANSDFRKTPLIQTLNHAGRPQVIQAVDIPRLIQLATEAEVVVELVASVGDTLIERSPLLHVYGAQQPIPEAGWRSALALGDERTFEQDPKYALRLVVDIAIKALSPAINDPTTAVQALDQIEDLLLRLGYCRLESGSFSDSAGHLRVVCLMPTWEDFLRLALDEIRAYGADSIQVMRRMKALIQNLLQVLPAHRQAALRHWEQRLQGSIARSFADAEEKRDASTADRQGLGIAQAATIPNQSI